MSWLNKIFGDPNAKVLSNIQPFITKINTLEDGLKTLNDEALQGKTVEFKTRFKNGETLDDLLPEAFAVVREASRRIMGMRHFDSQLIGGAVLHRGQIAEMHTGEGKTLTATLPVYLNALSGEGVHVVTVNDYLAKRDAVWMGKVYDFLGLTVGIIQNQLVSYKFNANKPVAELETPENAETHNFKVEYDFLEACSRKQAYDCDIVYGTNNEYGFDYLRDNMVQNIEDMSQRKLNFAIVDEVDSILIDEARTPLIISAPAEEATDKYYRFSDLVARLSENEDYNIDEKLRSATLTAGGIKKMEGWLGIENIYAEGGISMVHHLEQALRAMALFKRDRDYVVEKGEVIIVDEFTGRKMVGRRYSEGLHQAIEAKEKVSIQRESQTMATITFQNFFRMYKKIAGMTGTAVTEAEEFGKIYHLEVVVVPTHRARQRIDQPDKIYKTQDGKFKAIAKQVKELQKKGQPVLIGTVSVEKNELLARYLQSEGVSFEVLNAKNHEREGEIVAQAGRAHAVTLSTNMAGRGVDIILGGNPPDAVSSDQVKLLGGLYVIGTERHESRRIDNQLRGRAARQGDPGATQFYLSTEDDLMRIFGGDRMKRMMEMIKVPEDMPIEQKALSSIIESAQKKVEGFHFDTRKHLLEYDDVLNRHREVIYGQRRQILENFAREKRALEAGQRIEVVDGLDAADSTLRQMIMQMVREEVEQVVAAHTGAEAREEWNTQEIVETITTIFPLTPEEKQVVLESKNQPSKLETVVERTKLIDFLLNLAELRYQQLLVDKIVQPELMLELEKQIMLRSVDSLWIEHLVAIDYLRTGIGLRGYGQRDPLVEYKRETYRMFNELLSLIRKEVVYTIYKMSIGIQLAPSVIEEQAKNLVLTGAENTTDSPSSAAVDNNAATDPGRNDVCHCGSGKKFKKCHGV